MSEDVPLYPISEAADRTGLSVPRLRQWERRYGFPSPDRSQGGHRLYSLNDIADLRKVKAWVDQGIAPSQAVERLDQPPATAPDDHLGPLVEDLEAALLDGRFDTADHLLSQAYQLHPVSTVLLEVMDPVLRRIGDRWLAGEILVSQEHRASDHLRGKIRGLLGLYRHADGSRVVAATVPGERHEIGLLSVAVLLSQQGIQVDYVGSDLPLDDLATHARGLSADGVVLSATRSEHLEQLPDGALAGLAGTVVLGGQAVERDPNQADRLGATYLGDDPRGLADALKARTG